MSIFDAEIQRLAHAAAPWFLRPHMRTLLRAVGGVYDDFADRVFSGRRNAIPYAAGAMRPDGSGVLLECDEDVLAYHARDRGIRLYDTEPLLSKRFRLSRWRQLKKLRGSHKGELLNLQPLWLSTPDAVLPWMRIVFQDNISLGRSSVWYTLSPTGTLTIQARASMQNNWNYDGQNAKRTRFWLIIHLPPGYSTAIVYDDGSSVYDGGAFWDGITTLAVRDIVGAIKEAKAAHSRLAGVIVTALQPDEPIPDTVSGTHYPFDPTDTAQTLTDGSTSLPDGGNWGSPLDPITHLATRPSWATWAYEDNP